LKGEVSRIGNGTEYNNMKLIDGSRAKSITMGGTSATSAIASGKVADSVKVASFTGGT
jgi:hypothetical protein